MVVEGNDAIAERALQVSDEVVGVELVFTINCVSLLPQTK
jgi:hypothetical protein